jgi:hypothetical protein
MKRKFGERCRELAHLLARRLVSESRGFARFFAGRAGSRMRRRWRRDLALFIGWSLGIFAGSSLLSHALPSAAGWDEFVQASPRSAEYVRCAVAYPLPMVAALVVSGLMTFLEVHGVLPPARPGARSLPPIPFDSAKTQLILGEEHNQDGTRSETPRWLVLPEQGMTTGILVTGATGAAKTSAAQYPFTAQLIRLHADSPEERMGGLIIDAKGNYAAFVREQCRRAGRLEDYYEVSLESGVRYNVIGRPDLSAPALGGHIGDMISNVQGDSYSDPFWRDAAKDLATQVIRLVRLAQGREPTMLDLYQVATSETLFDAWMKLADERVKAGLKRDGEPDPAAEEYESLRFWQQSKAANLDPKLKGSIAAGLNVVTSLFDVPEIARVFCPGRDQENFRGFDELIARGQIVALRLPYSRYKTVSEIVGTMTKLNFFDAVLNRLARAEASHGTPGRMVFFVADEYDGYVTQPADGNFLAKCREAKCCTIIATQSYESLVSKLRDEHVAAQLLSNLRTKIWLCAEDNFTAQQAANLCGEVERDKVSHSRNENVRRSAFSFLDGKILSADSGSVGKGETLSPHREHLFPPRAFTQLKVGQAIVKAFDGTQVLEPRFVYLKPMHQDPNRSWFEGEQGNGGPVA